MVGEIITTLKIVRRVPFLIWLFIIQLFLLVNVSLIAEAGQVETFRTVLIVYMLGEVLFYAVARNKPNLNLDINRALPYFVGGFVITTLMMLSVGYVARGMEVTGYATNAFVYLIVLHSFVVAVAEELIFRGLLPSLITWLPSQILFSLFHASAYGWDVSALVVAFVGGCVFYGITKYTNIFMAMGCHAGYNLVLSGVWVLMV